MCMEWSVALCESLKKGTAMMGLEIATTCRCEGTCLNTDGFLSKGYPEVTRLIIVTALDNLFYHVWICLVD
jgi:hypothetical protein